MEIFLVLLATACDSGAIKYRHFEIKYHRIDIRFHGGSVKSVYILLDVNPEIRNVISRYRDFAKEFAH